MKKAKCRFNRRFFMPKNKEVDIMTTIYSWQEKPDLTAILWTRRTCDKIKSRRCPK